MHDRSLRVLFVGRQEYPVHFPDHQTDYRLFTDLTRYFSTIHIIVQAADYRGHVWSRGRITVHYLPLRSNLVFFLQAIILSLRICRRERIDLISGSDPVGGAVGAIVKRVNRVPLLVQLRGQVLNPSPTTSWEKRLMVPAVSRFASAHADLVRCVSEEVRQRAIAAGIGAEKLRVERGRCDPQLFDPDRNADARKGWRERLGWQDKRVVGFTGTLVPLKGVDYLLRAAAILMRQHPDLRVLIVGEGPERRRLEALCDDLELGECVHFAGRVPHDQVPGLLAACDLFAFPSLTEGVPRAIMEAMAMRLPVVACAVGGIPELVEDGATGLLVPPRDPRRLAEALEALLAGDLGSQGCREAARQSVVRRHSWNERVAGFAALHYLAAGRIAPTQS